MENTNKFDRLSWLAYQTVDQPKTLFKKDWYMLVLNCTNFICHESLQIGFTGRMTEPDGETGYQRSIETSGTLEDGNKLQLISEYGLGPPTDSVAISLRSLSEIKDETDESTLLGFGDPEEIDLEEAEEYLSDGGVIYASGLGEQSDRAFYLTNFQVELGVPDRMFDIIWDRIFEDSRIDLAYLCVCIHAFSDELAPIGRLAQDKLFALEEGMNLACINFLRLDKLSTNGPGISRQNP